MVVWFRSMIWMFTICKWYQSILVWSNSFVDYDTMQFQFLVDVISEINTIWSYFKMFQFFHINCSVLRRLDFVAFLSSRLCTLCFVSPLQPIRADDDAKLPIFSTTKKDYLSRGGYMAFVLIFDWTIRAKMFNLNLQITSNAFL